MRKGWEEKGCVMAELHKSLNHMCHLEFSCVAPQPKPVQSQILVLCQKATWKLDVLIFLLMA